VNSANVTLGFTVATPIPVGGSFFFSFPSQYFSFLNNSFLVLLSGSDFFVHCRCLHLKDLSGTLLDHLSCRTFILDSCVNCPSSTNVEYRLHSSVFVFSFVAPKPGNYRLIFSIAIIGGLAATYYEASCTSTALKHWTLSCPPTASLPSGTAAQWTLTNSAGRSGVNLAGFIKAPTRGSFNFFLRTLTGRGSGDLWIGNSRVIASEGLQEGSFSFTALLHYDFQISYSKFNCSNTTMQLEWESNKMVRQVVGENFLFSSDDMDSLNADSSLTINSQ
jgi:hypothetical protein